MKTVKPRSSAAAPAPKRISPTEPAKIVTPKPRKTRPKEDPVERLQRLAKGAAPPPPEAALPAAPEAPTAPDPTIFVEENIPTKVESSRERNTIIQAQADEAFLLPYEAPFFDIRNAINNPQQELAARVLCRRRLLPFIQRFRPKYLAGWVHADICRRIERFVERVERGEEPRLLLMMPPRSGKSEISSRHTPAWILGKHPEWEIIAASHTASLTMSFSRYLRDLVRSRGYEAIFPDTRLDPNSQSVENWSIAGKGGGYFAAGVGTGITGRGAHVLLLDDLVKDMMAADSATVREATWEWYMSTAYTRLAPGGGVLGLMTWWNEDDWAGRIQSIMASGEGDKFEIVRYPAINEIGDEFLLPDDSIIEIQPGTPVPDGARLTRPHRTAIHPARYTTEAMLRIKGNLVAGGQKRVWDALYQQNPMPDDGVFFLKENFRFYSTEPARRHLFIYQAWDFAITENASSDYTVGITIGVDHRSNVYVLDMVRFRSDDSTIITDAILDAYEKWNPEAVGFEDGQIWKTMKAPFMKACEERKLYPAHEELVPLTDKRVRATPLRGRMQLGKIYFNKFAPYYDIVSKELLQFPNAKHDDTVDALAWAVRLSLPRSVPPPPVSVVKSQSWKDALATELSAGHGGSHMAS